MAYGRMSPVTRQAMQVGGQIFSYAILIQRHSGLFRSFYKQRSPFIETAKRWWPLLSECSQFRREGEFIDILLKVGDTPAKTEK